LQGLEPLLEGLANVDEIPRQEEVPQQVCDLSKQNDGYVFLVVEGLKGNYSRSHDP